MTRLSVLLTSLSKVYISKSKKFLKNVNVVKRRCCLVWLLLLEDVVRLPSAAMRLVS